MLDSANSVDAVGVQRDGDVDDVVTRRIGRLVVCRATTIADGFRRQLNIVELIRRELVARGPGIRTVRDLIRLGIVVPALRRLITLGPSDRTLRRLITLGPSDRTLRKLIIAGIGVRALRHITVRWLRCAVVWVAVVSGVATRR